MSQIENAKAFAALHQKDNPLVLYNIWDAGGAKAVAEAGAAAIATGSWSIAAAHGFEDGEAIPLDLMLTIVARICDSVKLPVTVDFEGGYATKSNDVAANVRRVLQTGAVGINFEDRIVGGVGLHSILDQSARIAAIRQMSDAAGMPLFINARTDLFLSADPTTHSGLIFEALEREKAYAEAGASGFFAPGLTDRGLLTAMTSKASLPVNAMRLGDLSSAKSAAAYGIARFSYGPAPYFDAMSDLKARVKDV